MTDLLGYQTMRIGTLYLKRQICQILILLGQFSIQGQNAPVSLNEFLMYIVTLDHLQMWSAWTCSLEQGLGHGEAEKLKQVHSL